jgi:hypothetical protein
MDTIAERFVAGKHTNWRDLYEAGQAIERELIFANAEITRLKANIGCARDQGSTQFCAEVVALRAEFDAFRQQAREWIEDAHQEGFKSGVDVESLDRLTFREIDPAWNRVYNDSKAAKRRDAIK